MAFIHHPDFRRGFRRGVAIAMLMHGFICVFYPAIAYVTNKLREIF